MRYFRSQYSFKQYRPYKSAWQRFSGYLKKRKSRQVVARPIDNQHRGNPFKKIEKASRFDSGRVKVIILASVIIIWAILMLYSPFFNITAISYNGLRNISFDNINSFVRTSIFKCNHLLPCKNYFFVNTTGIEKKLLDNFSLASVRVEKAFPGELQIEFVEKISSVIYDNGSKYFMLDTAGSATKYLSDVDPSEFKLLSLPITSPTSSLADPAWLISSTGSSTAEHAPDFRRIKKSFGSYPIIFDARAMNIEEKQTNVLADNIIKSIIFWYGTLEKQGIGAIKYFEMNNLEGIKAYTNQSWDLYFKINADQEGQLSRLKTILRDNKPGEYVDLRYEGRVYWK